MSLIPPRRDRTPGPSLIASDGDLRHAQRRAAATRAGIWVSLAAGWLGLAVAVTIPRVTQAPAAPVTAPSIIAPPTGYAEQFIELWLRGAPDGQAAGALRAMAPTVDIPQPSGAARATVEKVVAVRSVPMGGRTWQVTVAATMLLPASAQSAGDAQSSAQAAAQGSAQADSGQAVGAQLTVRYFAVPVQMVRSSGSTGSPDALAVVAAPALVAAPAVLSAADPVQRAYPVSIVDGSLRQTVAEYLAAYLTGVGDSGRYLSPGARVPSPGAAYAQVALDSLSASGPVPSAPADGAVLDVQAVVRASDAVGAWPLSYPLRLQARAGRWEVAALAPAPSSSPSSSGAGSPQPGSSSSNGVR